MRKRRSDRYFHLIFFLFACFTAAAQDVSFVATPSATRVIQHTVFEIQFELNNAQGDGFQPPDFGAFTVVGGPAMGSSTIIINGQVSRSESWSYSLLAKQPGKFTIGPAQITAGRRKISTKPVTIEVVKAEDAAANPSGGSGAPIKLIAHVEPGDYYPGQQIVLEYKLVFSENVQSANILSEDDYADFFVQPFNSFSREATLQTENGVTYATRIIKAMALFAHQSGSYTINPMVLEAGINAPSPFNQGFFSMRRLQNVQVVSEPVTINILPLPNDQSAISNSGAVGQYELHTQSIGPTQLTTDNDFVFRLQINGNGDARRWDPPRVVTDGAFDLYDPRIIDDRTVDIDGSIRHARTIEYVMIPQEAGEFNVFVPFRFFNPETKQYETVYSDTIRLQVSRGQGLARRAIHSQQDSVPVFEPRTVHMIKTNDRFWLSVPHLFLLGLLLTGTGFGLWKTYERQRDESIPREEKIRSVALREARHELDQLSSHHLDLPDKTFFEKATGIYYRFLEHRFSIPPADLDEQKIISQLQSAGISEGLQKDSILFFQKCLSLRYGAAPPGFTRQEMMLQCREIMDSLDKSASVHI